MNAWQKLLDSLRPVNEDDQDPWEEPTVVDADLAVIPRGGTLGSIRVGGSLAEKICREAR